MNEMTSKFRLLHTMIRVMDMDKSIAFYTRILGMKLLRRKDYEGARFTLSLSGTEMKSPIQSSSSHTTGIRQNPMIWATRSAT